MKKLLCILVTLCMLLSLLPAAALAAKTDEFTDMPPEDNWASAALTAAVENGLLLGSDGKLMPDGELTRAQLAAIVNRAFGAADTADVSAFTDVPASAWYTQDVAKAVRMGTLRGSGDAMRPEAPVTRQEAFTVLARAFMLTDGDAASLSAFSDAAQVADWAAPALSAMVRAGYVSGSGGALRPLSTVTRAEFAQVMYRMVSEYFSRSGVYTRAASGNLLINAADVTLKDLTVTGDLVIGEGVGNGDVELDNVTVKGRVVVRGGGVNSIVLKNKSNVGSILVGKTGDGGVRVRAEEGCSVEVVYVDDGRDDVILVGRFNQVAVQTDTPVVLTDATVTGLTIAAENAAVKLDGKTSVSAVSIPATASGSKLEVTGTAAVSSLESAAESVKVFGQGDVKTASVSGNDTAVDVKGTSVIVAEGVTGVTQNGTEVKPAEPSAGGGIVLTEITVTSDEQLVAAINNPQLTKIWLGSRTSTADQSFTIPASAGALTMGPGRELYVMENQYGNPTLLTIEAGASLSVAYMLIDGYVQNLGTLNSYAMLEIGGNGVLENRGALTVTQTLNNGYVADAGTLTGAVDGNVRTYTASATLPESSDPTLLTADVTLAANAAVAGPLFIPMGVDVTTGTYTLELNGDTHLAGQILASGGTVTVAADKTLTVTSATHDENVPNEDNGTLSLGSGGTLVNSGTVYIVHGMLFGLFGTITNNGLITLPADGGGIVLGEIGGENNWIEQQCQSVASQEELRQAVSDGLAVVITADMTLSASLTVERPLRIASGVTLNVASGATLELAEGADLLLLGSLENNGAFINSAACGGFVADRDSVVVNNGVFENRNHLGIFESSFTNNGVLNIGDGDNAHIILVSASLTNSAGGTVNNEKDLRCFSSADAGHAGKDFTVTNAGTFNNGPISQPASGAFINMTGGQLINTGSFVNNGIMELEGTALTSSGTFDNYNSSDLHLVGGSLTISGGSFTNEGYMRVDDEYGRGGENRVCAVSLGEDLFHDNSDWLDYTAVVYSETGLGAAETAQSGKTEGTGFGKYDRLDFATDMTITGDKELSAFEMYWVMANWDGETEVPVELTVGSTGRVTMGQNCTLHIEGGKLTVEGTLKTAAPTEQTESQPYIQGGAVEIWPTGSFEASGTVTNNGSFVIRWYDDGSGVLERSGTVTDPPANALKLAIVRTAAGFAAATAEGSGYNRMEIKEDSLIELTADASVGMDTYVEPGSSLVVPYGRTLTLTSVSSLFNDGDISVLGSLIVAGSLNNYAGSLGIGAVSGAEEALVTVSGHMFNGGDVHIYATGTLDASGGTYEGEAPQVSGEGEYIAPTVKP